MVHAHSPGVDNKIFVDTGWLYCLFWSQQTCIDEKDETSDKDMYSSQTALQSGNPLKKHNQPISQYNFESM